LVSKSWNLTSLVLVLDVVSRQSSIESLSSSYSNWALGSSILIGSFLSGMAVIGANLESSFGFDESMSFLLMLVDLVDFSDIKATEATGFDPSHRISVLASHI
jgi:hypothetical protein